MKTFSFFIACAFAILLSNTTHAQSYSDLIGKWKIDTDQTVALMSTDAKSQFDSLDDASKNEILNDLLKQRFTFNADSTFLAGSIGANFYDGTWKLVSDELQLSFYNGANISQQVSVPNENALVLTIANSTSFITNFYLKKSSTN
ncbi:hypothetical protein [Ekhidna sp.]|uniref:hypothetical protein n=1 Tax=Ekhidna sp. TaxID=2608089 RepID=UPI003296B0D2